MATNIHLFNAAVIGENPETAFILKGDHLHAVEQSVADQIKDKNESNKVLSSIREALKALISYSQGKVEAHFLEIGKNSFSNQKDEQTHLIHQIRNIYTHLPHHNRNDLSSLIHHKQSI